jgi:zinc D-Ala-D-Ala carboxypeptidase
MNSICKHIKKSIARLTFLLTGLAMWSATCHTPTAPIGPQDVGGQLQGTAKDTGQALNQVNDSTGVCHYTKEELLGQFEPAKHPDFVLIESPYTGKKSIYMQGAAYAAFVQMHAAAVKAGVAIQIISATRNFDYQRGIWEKKWLREKYKGMSDREKVADIMRYSSMPGTSRHHWGTDVDFNSVELSFWQSGPGQKMYKWLLANASSFGFYQTYTNKSSGRSGYEEEKWHWSYLPLAKEMHRQYLSQITYVDIQGFNGCKVAEELQVFEKYVNGIDSICMP